MAYTQGSNTVEAYTNGLPPILSLNAASAANTNGTVLDGLCVRSSAVIQIAASTGVTAGAVQLQSSLDGQNFWNVGSPITVTAPGTTAESYSLPANSGNIGRYFRASVSTAVTGGSVSVWIGTSG